MDLELLGSLGWREGLMAIIALLVVYIVVLFFRMRRLQRSMAAIPPLAAQSAVAAYSAIQEPPPVAAAVAPPAGNDASAANVEASVRVDAGKPEFAWNEPPPEIPGQALIDALQREFYHCAAKWTSCVPNCWPPVRTFGASMRNRQVLRRVPRRCTTMPCNWRSRGTMRPPSLITVALRVPRRTWSSHWRATATKGCRSGAMAHACVGQR
jgi:hypothetical protein